MIGRQALATITLGFVAIACGTNASTPTPEAGTPTSCGSATCSADEVCLHQCFAHVCSFPPDDLPCPDGYVAAEVQSSEPCCVVQPPPHCVVPSQATPQDCEPYGQLMFYPNNPNMPPIACGCLD